MRQFISSILPLVIIGGCATAPEQIPEDQVSVSEVIEAVRCELHRALVNLVVPDPVKPTAKKNEWLLSWALVFKLGLKTSQKGDGSAEGSFVVPIHQGKFTIGIAAGISETAIVDSTFTFYGALSELHPARPKCRTPEHRSDRHLTGNLGLGEWLARIVEAVNKDAIDPSLGLIKVSATARVGHKLDFVIKASGSANPKFNIVRTSRHEIGGSLKVGGERERTHSLDIALVAAPAIAVGPTAFKALGPKGALDLETIRRLDSVLNDLQLRSLSLRTN